LKIAALPAPADLPQPATIPAPIPGSVSILIGTFDNARQAEAADAQLRKLNLTPYAIDLVLAPDNVLRRIMVGRYTTREQVGETMKKVAPSFPAARVILGSREHFRYEIP